MTDIELLPLPDNDGFVSVDGGDNETFLEFFTAEQMQDYARVNVAHATAAKDAEIDALRAEVAEWKRVAAAQAELHGEAETRADKLQAEVEQLMDMARMQAARADAAEREARHHSTRAERLAEALREARDAIEDWAGYASDYFREKHDLAGDLAKIDALLRTPEFMATFSADKFAAQLDRIAARLREPARVDAGCTCHYLPPRDCPHPPHQEESV